MLKSIFVRTVNFIRKGHRKTFFVLLTIIAVGIFLRSYNFRGWLDFESDQARDLSITEKTVDKGGSWPLLGPDMSHSKVGKERFHVGPMYYDFQILSGYVFGARPETAAYPDLFFSILSIPLFYFLLKRYFRSGISLALTGIYAVSFYIIQYSRFAYNPNLTPFFVILFLLSMLEFLDKGKKTPWSWATLTGIAIGIGVQLHVTLLAVFPVTACLIFLYLIWNDWRISGKLAVVILVAFVLNAGQLIYEAEHSFGNTKVLFSSVAETGTGANNSFPMKLAMNTDCQMQANFHMLSSLGDEVGCDYSLIHFINPGLSPYTLNAVSDYRDCITNFLSKASATNIFAFLAFSVVFSIFGYGYLIYYFRKEKGGKKQFLGLIILYCLVSFLVLLPVIGYSPLRYFIVGFFVPFLFLGFLAHVIIRKFPVQHLKIIIFVFGLILLANFVSIGSVAKELSAGNRSGSLVCGPDVIVFGEIEPMVSYITTESYPQNEAYILHASRYTFFDPFKFMAEKNNIALSLVSGVNKDNIPAGKPLFYFLENYFIKPDSVVYGHKIVDYKRFSKITIYKLEN